MGKIDQSSSFVWRIFIDGPRPAAEQMARDEALAQTPVPTARLYRWAPPAISLGWKQPRPEWCEPARWTAAGLEAVERPTGGGIAVHGSDVSIGVVVPRAAGCHLDTLMSAVCGSAAELCRAYGVAASTLLDAPADGRVTCCLAEPSPYAVLVGGRKVAGFALRRYPWAWLIQGSLLVRPIPEGLARAMPSEAIRELETRAVSLAEAAGETVTEQEAAERWAAHWASWWEAPARGALVHDAM
ncbi:MAG: hypothetical protein HYT90_04175 [Candidatus Omnitrophica bacterium]|nr:hypothetical protein [Candidatus Omnitrophota bacterium]